MHAAFCYFNQSEVRMETKDQEMPGYWAELAKDDPIQFERELRGTLEEEVRRLPTELQPLMRQFLTLVELKGIAGLNESERSRMASYGLFPILETYADLIRESRFVPTTLSLKNAEAGGTA